MVFVRLVLLAFLTLVAYGIGQGTNNAAAFFAIVFFVAAPTFYFLPSIEAALRKSEKGLPIGMLNLLLGWTVIGWVAAYIWALSSAVEGSRQALAQMPAPPPPAPPPSPPEMECPHCAEIIKRAAKVCKHCGRDVAPAA